MRLVPALLIAAAVAACSPAVPDSGAPADAALGGDHTAYRSLNGPGLTTPAPAAGVETSVLPVETGTAATVTPPVATATATTLPPATTAGATAALPPAGTAAATPGTSAPTVTAGVAPTGTGARGAGAGSTGGGAQPGVVSYAMATSNTVGQKLYGRSIFALPSRAARNCADHPSADAAQEAFLAAGGPARDRLNLDPDGDGFACDWDPAPYRRMVAAARG